MSRATIMTLLKRAVTPFLAVSLAIALLTLYESKTVLHTAEPRSATSAAGYAMNSKQQVLEGKWKQNRTSADHTATATDEPLSDLTIVILDSGKALPLAFKLGGRYIKVPAPSSWPRIGNQGPADSENGRYAAAIIDSADVLRANGYRADDAFALVVGGTELNASNTFRIKGNHQADMDKAGSDPTVEYHTQAGEPGIWRSLEFKNIVLSHAQVPSLEDHLVLPQDGKVADKQITAHEAPMSAQPALVARSTSTANTGQVTPLEDTTPESTRKYVEALNSPDATVRADAIQSLIVNGYREAAPNSDSNATMESIISKSLLDNNPNVRATTLDALDAYEGNLPQATLSHMALNDSNPGLRVQSLDLLVERFGQQAAATVKEARHDPDPRVSRMADQLLIELTNQSQP
jgi:hypothetical protein